MRPVACPPALGYRITGNRRPVKGAEGTAQPFTLDGQAVFCHSSLFRHSVGAVHSQLGVNDSPVLSAAGPFFRDIQHGQIQHFQQAVVRGRNSLGFCHFAKLTVEAFYCVGRIDEPPKLFRKFETGAQVIGSLIPVTSLLSIQFNISHPDIFAL